MDHVLSLSYGKDSLACLAAIEILGLPIDRIIHAEVWATDTIPADPPEMMEFKKRADKIIKERWGITVEHVRAERNYEQIFYSTYKKGKWVGKQYGWPFMRGPWCNDRLKMAPLEKATKGTHQYIGYAIDEKKKGRRERVTAYIEGQRRINESYPLVDVKWTEEMCREWCEKNGLLSPIYTTATRGGCWFCHNQSTEQLRLLRKNHPEYWAIMLEWDTQSFRTFKADGRMIWEYEKRFSMEDEGLLHPDDKRFRWSMLAEELNFRMF